MKRPISKVEEFKSEWTSKYGFPPTDSDIFNAGMLRERNAAPASPVASVLNPSDADLRDLYDVAYQRNEFEYWLIEARALLAASMSGDRK